MSAAAYLKLYERFYANGVPMTPTASSHWKDCARQFIVRKTSVGEFQCTGYGFGTSGSASVRSRIASYVGNTVHLSYLDIPRLSADVRWARTVVQRMGLHFSQDAFRQVCTLNLLARYVSAPKRIWVIGDGHGILSALLHARFPGATICLIDLGAVLFFQAYHLYQAFPAAVQCLADEASDDGAGAVFRFWPAELLDDLPSTPLDVAINIASMQEMDPSVIAKYFSILRRCDAPLFYCCNRLEKHMPGGEVTRFRDYPWSHSDEHLVDEPCPWHQWFFGFAHSPHVSAWGIPLPFTHRFDGVHWHRLTRLAKVR